MQPPVARQEREFHGASDHLKRRLDRAGARLWATVDGLGGGVQAREKPRVAHLTGAPASSQMRPAIDAVGVKCFGQRSVHDWCVWQDGAREGALVVAGREIQQRARDRGAGKAAVDGDVMADRKRVGCSSGDRAAHHVAELAAALEAAGIAVVRSPADIGSNMKEVLGR